MAPTETPPDPILYPAAIWEPLTGHSAPGTLEQRNLIVIHCTAGFTARSAIDTFKASAAPRRVSAHFVIDRDGTVYQLLDIRETAWHASQVNSRSVGIEHAAIPTTLMATEEQYQASARLVEWLTGQMGIPIDGEHVMGHNQASPSDNHTLCPEGALHVSDLIARAQEIQEGDQS
jgi:N-acetyl-anhydromuramyl-L-alanine amidase AmpD